MYIYIYVYYLYVYMLSIYYFDNDYNNFTIRHLNTLLTLIPRLFCREKGWNSIDLLN